MIVGPVGPVRFRLVRIQPLVTGENAVAPARHFDLTPEDEVVVADHDVVAPFQVAEALAASCAAPASAPMPFEDPSDSGGRGDRQRADKLLRAVDALHELHKALGVLGVELGAAVVRDDVHLGVQRRDGGLGAGVLVKLGTVPRSALPWGLGATGCANLNVSDEIDASVLGRQR